MTETSPAIGTTANEVSVAPAIIAPRRAMPSDVSISPRTGEVTRPALVVIATAISTIGSLASIAALIMSLLLMAYKHLPESGWLVSRINPEPSSWQAVLMPLMTASLLIPAVVASGLAAFHSWNGKLWARRWALVAILVSFLGLLVGGPLTWISIAGHLIGNALLWLPSLRRYCQQQTDLLHVPEQSPRNDIPETIQYGPVARFR
ncbi:MAG: hypothetical protein ACRDAX_01615 [Propionibacteriaceae bacterium]